MASRVLSGWSRMPPGGEFPQSGEGGFGRNSDLEKEVSGGVCVVVTV